MKPQILIVAALFCILHLSCQKTDFSSPDSVMQNYISLLSEKKYEQIYEDFISSKSKEMVTQDEFIKYKTNIDTTFHKGKLTSKKIIPLDILNDNPSYKRFKLDGSIVLSDDTTNIRNYYTLINENGEWKVIWTLSLIKLAYDQFDKGNYIEAQKSFEKIKAIDPYNGKIYIGVAWCSLRGALKNVYEDQQEILKNVKYALQIEKDNPSIYNALGNYYLISGEDDLAIEKFKLGVSLCLNEKDKNTFFGNISLVYWGQNNYNKAKEYIGKSIAIDSSKPFGWLKLGGIELMQNKYSLANQCFERALKGEKMDAVLMAELYYSYALSLFYTSDYTHAKKYIDEALNVEPNSEHFKTLYRQIIAYIK